MPLGKEIASKHSLFYVNKLQLQQLMEAAWLQLFYFSTYNRSPCWLFRVYIVLHALGRLKGLWLLVPRYMLSLVLSHLLKYITWVFAWMKMWISLASYILHSLICALEHEILGICLHRHNTFKINSSKWIQTQDKSLNSMIKQNGTELHLISMSHQLRPLWSSKRADKSPGDQESY